MRTIIISALIALLVACGGSAEDDEDGCRYNTQNTSGREGNAMRLVCPIEDQP